VTAAEAPAIGFIGLGQMGQPMAARLAAWPGGLVVHDVRPAAMTPLAEAGATAAGSVAEVAQRAGIISVMVRDDDQVRDVVPQVAAAAKAAGGPAIIAIHSTIGPGTAADLAARYGAAGIEIVDAPVSGGFKGAQDGRLAVMMGSSRAAYERCREPFGCFADLVLHLGPAGAGTQAKLARNLLHFVAFSAAAEAQRLAEAAGLDLRKLAGVVRHSDAVTGGPGSIMLRRTTAPLAPDDPLRPILEHVRALGEKDLSLALELGTQLGVDLPLAEHARRHFAAGLGLPPGADPAEDPGEDPGADSGEPLVAEAGGDAEATPRARGLAMMSEVYGWDVQDGPGDWFGITVEHLFGSIWTRPGLTMRDRRLLLLGLLVGQGQQDVADIQIGAALRRGELSPDALREIAIFLTHYVGWPGGARLSMQVEQLITQQAKE
jgi:3-hydroxyisobutyrate dehydrogenase-like beta-hydroxyacid dehydrogenase/alkylhydroperoxidase/carboxymuconolactone decarboxylase family protein YurZ